MTNKEAMKRLKQAQDHKFNPGPVRKKTATDEVREYLAYSARVRRK